MREADHCDRRQWKPVFGEDILKTSPKGRDLADTREAVREKVDSEAHARERIRNQKIETTLIAEKHGLAEKVRAPLLDRVCFISRKAIAQNCRCGWLGPVRH